MTLFLPGRVTNPLNGSHSHWSVRAKWAKRWRTMSRFTAADEAHKTRYAEAPTTPKRIRFIGQVVRRFDDDNFLAACKPVRDGLKDAGIIQDDGPDCGHVFLYAQVVATPLGVRVEVENVA